MRRNPVDARLYPAITGDVHRPNGPSGLSIAHEDDDIDPAVLAAQKGYRVADFNLADPAGDVGVWRRNGLGELVPVDNSSHAHGDPHRPETHHIRWHQKNSDISVIAREPDPVRVHSLTTALIDDTSGTLLVPDSGEPGRRRAFRDIRAANDHLWTRNGVIRRESRAVTRNSTLYSHDREGVWMDRSRYDDRPLQWSGIPAAPRYARPLPALSNDEFREFCARELGDAAFYDKPLRLDPRECPPLRPRAPRTTVEIKAPRVVRVAHDAGGDVGDGVREGVQVMDAPADTWRDAQPVSGGFGSSTSLEPDADGYTRNGHSNLVTVRVGDRGRLLQPGTGVRLPDGSDDAAPRSFFDSCDSNGISVGAGGGTAVTRCADADAFWAAQTFGGGLKITRIAPIMVVNEKSK